MIYTFDLVTSTILAQANYVNIQRFKCTSTADPLVRTNKHIFQIDCAAQAQRRSTFYALTFTYEDVTSVKRLRFSC